MVPARWGEYSLGESHVQSHDCLVYEPRWDHPLATNPACFALHRTSSSLMTTRSLLAGYGAPNHKLSKWLTVDYVNFSV